MERWESMYFDGRRAGFLVRTLEDGVLITRTAFGGAEEGEEALGPAERYLSESVITLGENDSPRGWHSFSFQDSSAPQRATVERERAGLAAEALPSYAEWLLLQDLAHQQRSVESYVRLEESHAFTGAFEPARTQIRRGVAEPVQRPDGQALVADKVQIITRGLVLSIHWIVGGEVIMSDWGGPAVSVPVGSLAEALDGFDDNMTTFALRGFGF